MDVAPQLPQNPQPTQLPEAFKLGTSTVSEASAQGAGISGNSGAVPTMPKPKGSVLKILLLIIFLLLLAGGGGYFLFPKQFYGMIGKYVGLPAPAGSEGVVVAPAPEVTPPVSEGTTTEDNVAGTTTSAAQGTSTDQGQASGTTSTVNEDTKGTTTSESTTSDGSTSDAPDTSTSGKVPRPKN